MGGQYVTQVRAPGAPNSETMQPFTLVNLDVVPKEVHSISDAIDKYCADSIIEGKPYDRSRLTFPMQA